MHRPSIHSDAGKTPIRLAALGVLLGVLLLGPGCGASTGEKYPTPLRIVDTVSESGMLRMLAGQPYSAIQSEPNRTIDAGAFYPMEINHDGGVRSAQVAEIDRIASADFGTARLTLTSRDSDWCILTWSGELEPDLDTAVGVRFPVVSDGEPHEYVVTLRDLEYSTWQGRIDQVAVAAETANGTVSIHTFSLEPDNLDLPQRPTLNNVTMEAMPAASVAWNLVVPPDGVLEFFAGLAPRAWEVDEGDGVVFRVRLRTNKDPYTGLLEKEYVPGIAGNQPEWMRMEADLRRFAGQPVQIMFDTDPRENTFGDYVLWGNPIIYTKIPDRTKTPVILLSIDTLRADHLRLYGYDRDTAPNLTAFAEEAVLFENAFTPETWTLTAHISMLTGLYPNHHQVNATTNLPESTITLPEVLAEEGYACGGFTGYRIWMLPWRGMAHGFDVYSTPEIVRSIYDTKVLLDPWLDSHHERPFFLFFHNYDLHSKYEVLECAGCDLPYYPPRESDLHFSKQLTEPESLRAEGRSRATSLLFDAQNGRDSLSEDETTYLKALYDDAIRGVDTALGDFFQDLRETGVFDRSMIIVTADHGEHFGEHGQYLHEHLYEGSARVPLLIRFPGGEHGGRRIPEIARLIDLYPTILDYLDLETPETDGRSLLPLITGDATDVDVFIRRQHYEAIRTPRWKLIRDKYTGSLELYNIAEDPHETRDVFDGENPAIPTLTAELDRFFEEHSEGWHVAFFNAEPKWRGTAVLSSEDTVDRAKLFFGGTLSREDLMKRDDHSFTVTLGPLPREELLFRTQSEESEVRFVVRSESPFRVRLPDGTEHDGASFDGILTSALKSQAKPDLVGLEDVTIPTLIVWHDRGHETGSAAPELTPEDREALDGLGYGH